VMPAITAFHAADLRCRSLFSAAVEPPKHSPPFDTSTSDRHDPLASSARHILTASERRAEGQTAGSPEHPVARQRAILITARSVNQAYEWMAHARIARTEKLPDDVIERIRTRGDLSALPPRYARSARVVQHVLAYASIPQGLQDAVKNELGMPGLIAGAVLMSTASGWSLIYCPSAGSCAARCPATQHSALPVDSGTALCTAVH